MQIHRWFSVQWVLIAQQLCTLLTWLISVDTMISGSTHADVCQITYFQILVAPCRSIISGGPKEALANFALCHSTFDAPSVFDSRNPTQLSCSVIKLIWVWKYKLFSNEKSIFVALLGSLASSGEISPLIDHQIVTRICLPVQMLQHATNSICCLSFPDQTHESFCVSPFALLAFLPFATWHLLFLLSTFSRPYCFLLSACRPLIVRLALPFSPWAAVPFSFPHVFRSC